MIGVWSFWETIIFSPAKMIVLRNDHFSNDFFFENDRLMIVLRNDHFLQNDRFMIGLRNDHFFPCKNDRFKNGHFSNPSLGCKKPEKKKISFFEIWSVYDRFEKRSFFPLQKWSFWGTIIFLKNDRFMIVLRNDHFFFEKWSFMIFLRNDHFFPLQKWSF